MCFGVQRREMLLKSESLEDNSWRIGKDAFIRGFYIFTQFSICALILLCFLYLYISGLV